MTLLTANDIDNEIRREVAKRIETIHFDIQTILCTMTEGQVRPSEDFVADAGQLRHFSGFKIRDVEVPIQFTMERRGDRLRVNGKVTIVVGSHPHSHVFRDRKQGPDIEGIANCILDWANAVDAGTLRQIEVEKNRNERRGFAESINRSFGIDVDADGPRLALNKHDRVYIEMPSDLSDGHLYQILRFMKKELGL